MWLTSKSRLKTINTEQHESNHKIEHLAAGYEGKEVLHDVNLTIYQDDYLGIIGPNGGGKTTLMRLILGLMNPTEGNISYYKDGKPVKEITMGYLPQYNDLDKQFPISVYEVVLSGLNKSKSLFARFSKEHHQLVADTLDRMQLSDLKDRHIGALSGGQLQRVLLARAIVSKTRRRDSRRAQHLHRPSIPETDVRDAGANQQGMRHHHRKPRHCRSAAQCEAHRLREPPSALSRYCRHAEGKTRGTFPQSINFQEL